jgi:ADP-heptose:LPS heptosyltransferase
MNPIWEIVPYTSGKGMEVNTESRAFPHFFRGDINCIKGQSLDFVFARNVTKIDPQWWKVIKFGGYLVVIGEDVRTDIDNYEQIRCEKSLEGLFQVFRKREKGGRVFVIPDHPKKTCAVVRYGGYGDAIQSSSILPGLKEQGYHITFYGHPATYEVLKTDPHIDRFILQERNQVPHDVLLEFWKYESEKYDKWINLSESVESTLLCSSDMARFYWSKEARHKVQNVNYLEICHEIAGVPLPSKQKFYATPEEKAWAKKQKKGISIVYSMSGSAIHKLWPHMDALIARIMLDGNARVVLVGDQLDAGLMGPWANEERVLKKAGEWDMRQSMAFAQEADLVIGTETGLLNAMGLEDVPKIVLLSHSTEENLTKHWVNTKTIVPQVACHPCHRIIYSWDHCNRDETTGTALCAARISVETVWAALQDVFREKQRDRILVAA